jgi:hypothetical protein
MTTGRAIRVGLFGDFNGSVEAAEDHEGGDEKDDKNEYCSSNDTPKFWCCESAV